MHRMRQPNPGSYFLPEASISTKLTLPTSQTTNLRSTLLITLDQLKGINTIQRTYLLLQAYLGLGLGNPILNSYGPEGIGNTGDSTESGAEPHPDIAHFEEPAASERLPCHADKRRRLGNNSMESSRYDGHVSILPPQQQHC